MSNEKQQFKDKFNQRLVVFSIDLIGLCSEIKKDSLYWPISDQVIRSGTSIGANIFEAKGSSSKRDYMKFFEIALKSAYETEYWLIIIDETFDGLHNKITILRSELDEIIRVIVSAVLTMKGKKQL